MYDSEYLMRRHTMKTTSRIALVCCIGMPVSLIACIWFIVTDGLGFSALISLVCTAGFGGLFAWNNKRFHTQCGNPRLLLPYILPTHIASMAEAKQLIQKHMYLFSATNGCLYGYWKDKKAVRLTVFFENQQDNSQNPNYYTELYQESTCQILEGPHVPPESRKDAGHSEIRIFLIVTPKKSDALSQLLQNNAYHTLSPREGMLQAALVLQEQNLIISAFYGDHFGDAKKYEYAYNFLAGLFSKE